jgi:hypothetical protein
MTRAYFILLHAVMIPDLIAIIPIPLPPVAGATFFIGRLLAAACEGTGILSKY